MSRKIKTSTSFDEVMVLLNDLHKNFPTYTLGRHLSTALADYGNIWGMSDKEMLHALNKYKVELELDMPHVYDTDIDDIIKQGMNLNSIFDEEEDD